MNTPVTDGAFTPVRNGRFAAHQLAVSQNVRDLCAGVLCVSGSLSGRRTSDAANPEQLPGGNPMVMRYATALQLPPQPHHAAAKQAPL